jgi:hypothetical protein
MGQENCERDYAIRLYEREELTNLLETAGFAKIRFYGDFD